MPAPLQAFFKRVGTTVAGFSFAQKTVSILALLVLALGITGLSVWLSQPQYVPLFSGISASDASAITTQLHTDNVPYQLTDGGNTILVPQAQVYQERLKAAAANLPASSNQGYSLLDNMGVTTSEFQQDVTYKRAMEGELASTIDAMQGVKTASVKLAIPQPTVFTDQAKDPTASVFVDESAGTTLTAAQVQAIVHLVSSSTVGMKPTDVSVIDAAGNVLSSTDGATTGSTGDQAKAYDSNVQASVQSMLDKVLGPGNSTVVVSALMDNSTSTKTSDSYSIPTGAPQSSSTSQKETYTGTGAAAQSGVLGTSSTTNGVANTAANSGGNGSYSSDSTTSDNALNKTSITQQIPAGGVQRQTVSVAVDSGAASTAGVSSSQLQQMVANAAGVDTTRGDAVGVQLVNFSQANAQAAKQALAQADAQAKQAQLDTWIRTGLIAAGVLVAMIVAILVFRRRGKKAEVDDGFQYDELAAPTLAFTQVTPPTVPLKTPPPTPVSLEAEQRRAEIEQLAVDDPRRAADFLLSLMGEKEPTP
ncbi:flagellar basal-body MS-ring/collar protein FliF [Leifsonia sp. EB34]|uniref:flagellar basal-body MS-ring/collar protein FliF n=1 Tax=Leifsonia sp. EB34 TaxID=3156303 RepID=UPI0035196DE6